MLKQDAVKVKKKIYFAVIAITLSFNMKAERKLSFELPETYELANVILALTEYGRNDPYEVLKNTKYYREVLEFFAPVLDHPLLDSLN
jgi:hypothetical protein